MRGIVASIALAANLSTSLPSPPTSAASPVPSAADAAPAPLTILTATGLPLRVRVSFAANLFHWVDSLAGSSLAKVQRAHVYHFTRLAGALTPEDRALLTEFRRLREGAPRSAPQPLLPLADGTCVPSPPEGLTPRQKLSAAAATADSIEQLLGSASALLSAEDLFRLERVLRRFEPRFQRVWADLDYLQPFAARLLARLDEAPVEASLRRVAALLDAPLDGEVPLELSLVGVLATHLGTHAETNGDVALLEIRPGDDPDAQIAVVFHELAHALSRRMSESGREALAAGLLRDGPRGLVAWTLLHEALPTALGQGIAQARHTEEGLRPRQPWYDVWQVDLLAKAIYPAVARAYDAANGEGTAAAREPLPATIAASVPRQILRSMKPLATLNDAAFVAPRRLSEVLGFLLQASRGSRQWAVTLDRGVDRRWLASASCLPIVILLTRDDLSRLPGDFERGLIRPSLHERRSPTTAGLLFPTRRASGALALWMVAETDADTPRLLGALARREDWPYEATIVKRDERPPRAATPPAPAGVVPLPPR